MTLAGQESANICDGELREPAPEPAGRGPTIVLADSHQETRQSMRRLLGADYQVIAVADGLAALEAARQLEPDLIVSEAAAPELDGFGLLKAIRSEAALKHIAVVLVSARAGEGAEVEALDAGADDYLLKPLSARKFLARVKSNLELSRMRRRAGQALREGEQRFQLISESAPVMLWMGDAAGKCIYLNKAQRSFWNVALEDLDRFDWSRTLHPEDSAKVADAVAKAVEARAALEVEARFQRGDGAYRTLLVRATPRFDADGGYSGMIGVNIDVTDLRAMEAQLRDETERLRILSEAGAAIAAHRDLETIVQKITDAGVALTGAQFGAFFYNVTGEHGERYPLYALSGAPRSAFADFPLPRPTAVFEPTFSGREIVRSPDITKDPRYGKNGPHRGMPKGHLPVRSYLAVPVAIPSGEVLGGLFFGHAEPDRFGQEHEKIAEGLAGHAATAIENARLFRAVEIELNQRRRAESALRANEARLAFLDDLARASAHASGAREVLDITTRMLGESLGAQSCTYADVEPDGDLFTVRGQWRAEGAEPLLGEYRLSAFGAHLTSHLREGRPLVVRDVAAELDQDAAAQLAALGVGALISVPFVKHGTLTAAIGVQCSGPRAWNEEEIALLAEVAERSWAHIERVRASEQLRKLNATLEQRVIEAVAERASAEEQLRQVQKMDAIGQLTGGIAHDFNNMLAVVIGGLNLLRKRIKRGDYEVERFVEAAMEGAERAAALTQRLLAFSRQQPLAPMALDPNQLVASMTDLLARSLGEQIQVETELAPDLWTIHADRVQLESALLNLAVNARDAMPEGGRLSILTANVAIDAAQAIEYDLAAGDYVMLAVSDTGNGMGPEVLAKAFDPFFTTKKVGKGTGLGLSQVFGFVRQSGGHIKLASRVGAGTTARIYLPRFEGGSAQAEEPSPREPLKPASGERLLVVEDEERVRNVSVEALRELGYQVVAAASAAEALSLIDQGERPALLFTDMVMPDMNGRQLAELALQRLPGLRVLFTSGYVRETGEGAAEFGARFLPKPFTLEQLAAKVRSVLDAR